MRIALVRHACAGRKADWSGPDAERPLDPVGVEQALALAQLFDGRRVSRLLASPTRRCVQSLEDLARRSGLPITTVDDLCTDADPERLWAFLADDALDDAVLCTHGETLRALLPVLIREGLAEPGVPEDELLQKGSAWLLTIDPPAGDGSNGTRSMTLEHRMPASVRSCPAHASTS